MMLYGLFNKYRMKLFFRDKIQITGADQMHNWQATKLFVRNKTQAICTDQIHNK